MRRRIFNFLRNDRAGAGAFAGVALVALIITAGVVIDLGHIYVVKQQLQNAADSAALAGARGLFILNDPDNPVPATVMCDQARSLASATVTVNQADGKFLTIPAGDIQIGIWNKDAATGKYGFSVAACSNEINSVHVITRKTTAVNGPIELIFGSFLGKSNIELSTMATGFLGWPVELPFGFGFPLAIGYPYVPKIVGERKPVTFSPDWGDTGGWHCFLSTSADANELRGYIDGTITPPGCKIGDEITCLNGVAESVVNAADNTLKQHTMAGEPWIVYLPVIDATKMNQNREVLGFCAFEIENVDKKTKAISGDALGMYTSPGGNVSPTNPGEYSSLRSKEPKLVQ